MTEQQLTERQTAMRARSERPEAAQAKEGPGRRLQSGALPKGTKPAVVTVRLDNDGLHRRPNRRGCNWYFRWRNPADGRLHEKSCLTSSYGEAKEFRAAELVRLRELAGPADRQECTLEKAAELWLKKRELDGLAPGTLRLNKERLVPILRYMGGLKLRQVATPTILLAYKEKRLREISPRTFNMERTVLRGILRWAKLWRLIEDDFTAAREPDHGPGRALEPDQENRLLAAASEPGCEFILHVYLLARNTGMRRGEVLGLRLADIDLAGRRIHIRRASTKTDAGERSIPLNSQAYQAAEWLWNRAAKLGARQPEHFLFPARVPGRRHDPKQPQKTFRTAWRNLVKRAGLKGFRAHDLRHGFLSDLAAHDVAGEVAMELAGHRGLGTLRIYTHLRRSAREKREAQKRAAVAAILEVEASA